MSTQNASEDCCGKFDPSKWDEKKHVWDKKMFIRKSIPQIFHIPIPGKFGKAVRYLWEQAETVKANVEQPDFLLLAFDPSPWKSELYMSVLHEVPGADNVQLSGNFFSKVFDGPYTHIPQYIRDFDIYLSKENKLATRYFFYFATCPICSKNYGYNYIVAFAEV
jgi:hypothetical protein